MSAAATLSTAILQTILGRLALLFLSGAGGDLVKARDAASRMLSEYQSQTDDELRLAAEIISFGFHALEALSQSAAPDLPLSKVLRLRSCAVSLSRESHKAQRRLDQLRRDRATHSRTDSAEASSANATVQPEPVRPHIDKAIALIEETRQAAAAAAKPGLTWTQSFQQRQTAKRIAENLKKNQARHQEQNLAERNIQACESREQTQGQSAAPSPAAPVPQV